MRTYLLLILAVLPLTGRGLGAADAIAPKPTVAQFAWLAGSWSFEDQGRVVSEQWMPPGGGTMLGMSRTISGERTASYEFVMLRTDAAGDLFYDAHPSGQPPTSFKLVRFSLHEAVFENPEHDFPQRIIYRLGDDGNLTAAIEGTLNGQTRRIEYPYRRVVP